MSQVPSEQPVLFAKTSGPPPLCQVPIMYLTVKSYERVEAGKVAFHQSKLAGDAGSLRMKVTCPPDDRRTAVVPAGTPCEPDGAEPSVV